MMVVDMANSLPLPLADGIHIQRLSDTIIDRNSRVRSAFIADAVAVEVKDVRSGAVGVDVPDYFVAEAHFEGGVVGEDVAVVWD